VVPSDFTLSDRNMLAVQAKLPNRNGLARFEELWQVRGKGDVQNDACMRDCPVGEGLLSSLPDRARDAHGNLAEQNRIVGPTRGADTTRPAVTGVGTASLAVRTAAASGVGGTAVASVGPGVARGPGTVARDAGCLACHGIGNRIVGPSFREVAERYQGDAGALEKVAGRVRNGAQGAWGAIPMPPQPQLSPEDTVAVVRWILEGAKTSTSKE
jgi:cytochrome c